MNSWPHAPARVAMHEGAIFVTASTYHKEHFFHGRDRLKLLQEAVLEHAIEMEWRVQAWAVFPNHYHFVAHAPTNARLTALMKRIHGSTGNAVNKLDNAAGRTVWYRYRDTALTYEKSYLARLSYVHRNAVHHGIAKQPEEYEFCSAAWFKLNAPRPFFETVMTFPIDKVNVEDDF